MRVLVITISDRASRGEYQDLSGPAVEEVVRVGFPDAFIDRVIVPDEQSEILAALGTSGKYDWVLTTGGTGIGPRDITPQVTSAYCDYLLPGIAETLRAQSYVQTPQAMLSRAVAGVKGNTIIVNMPGSVKGARFCAELLIPVMKHASAMQAGEGH